MSSDTGYRQAFKGLKNKYASKPLGKAKFQSIPSYRG